MREKNSENVQQQLKKETYYVVVILKMNTMKYTHV